MGLWQWLTGTYVRPPTMGIASPWAPSDQLTRITFAELFPGVDIDLLPISRAEAMTVPAVAAARHRVVSTLARLPIRAYTRVPDSRDLADRGVLWAGATGLLDQPDDGEPHTSTMRKTLDDLLFAGAAWWGVTAAYAADTNGTTRPYSIVHIPTEQIGTDLLTGRPEVAESFLSWLAGARGVQLLAAPGHPGWPWLLRFDGPHEGLNVIGGRTFRSAVQLERAAQHASDNPVPSVELHQVNDADLADDEIAAMIAQWRTARRNGGVGFTNAAIELKTHGQQPEQLLINGRNQQAVDTARLVGIPAASIDAGIPGTALTYANLTDRLVDLINFGLSPYAAAVTARLSMNDVLPRGVSARFDYSELYPAATATAASHQAGASVQPSQGVSP